MRRTIIAIVMGVGLGGAGLLAAQPVVSGPVAVPPALRHFLQDELKKGTGGQAEADTVINWAAVPLADGQKEFVVLVSGNSWCGTGGCTLLVYETSGASFREIGHTPAVRQPIRVLATSTNGRPDLGAWRSWSDTQPYETRIQFNGRRYLMEKEATSLARGKQQLAGQTLIGENDKGTFLYKD